MGIDLCELTAWELSGLYASGRTSPVDVMKTILERIQSLDPTVNAFCQVADEALELARASEAHWQRGAPLSHVGPMTRCVEDAAQILTIITRPDSRDWYALPFEGADYARGLSCLPVPGGIRIACSPTLGLPVIAEAEIHDAVVRTAAMFRELGALVHVADPPGVAQCNAVHTTLWRACCRQLTDGMTDRWAELDPSLQASAQAGNGISRGELLGALIERGELGAAVNAFFERHDLLICPVYPDVAPSLAEVSSSTALFPHFTAWCNQLGLPAASLYAGMTATRLPVGIQIVGSRHADALVLWASHMLERAFGRAPFAELTRELFASAAGATPA
ncbi:amidase family protein [Burkholderia cenocepacia]|uniref:amidase family protein n=1 Tax=Burkholderia cenocepacia TaxID=95486 RepID=UPI00158E6CE2|nr:amidase family protein [Burkholderia cenocepacia]